MYTISSDQSELVELGEENYKVYFHSEIEEGKGTCHVCGRKTRYFKAVRIIGIEENYGNKVNENSDLGKKIIGKLKRVVRRETLCDHCNM